MDVSIYLIGIPVLLIIKYELILIDVSIYLISISVLLIIKYELLLIDVSIYLIDIPVLIDHQQQSALSSEMEKCVSFFKEKCALKLKFDFILTKLAK